ILAVDRDGDKIRIARAAGADNPGIRFELRDILEWDPPAGWADAVLMLDVLHYWRREDQRRMLIAARKALKPDGRLVLRETFRDPAGTWRISAAFERWAAFIGHNKTVQGFHYLSLDEHREDLAAAGFPHADITGCGGRGADRILVARP
ncbi:MAG: class I SAM-dependent methyltransferase, partial [Planctomycetota bacterium]|nr:class I SAM-dependent methyltransferase [Planctomycetota bacterium]